MYKFRKLKVMITRFLSNRTNLNLMQCGMYLFVGYIMGQHLTWIELGVMFVVLLGIQFITRAKAVADGMMFKHLMEQNNMEANEFLEYVKKQAEDLENKDLN